MASKKYARKADGSVRGINTPALNLEKPLGNENYDINIFNSNMDKIDTAVNNASVKIDNIGIKVEGLELKADKVSIDDTGNNFTSRDVEGALTENATKINKLSEEINGQRIEAININNMLDKCF